MPYNVILADPPWSYRNDGANRLWGLASQQYPTMTNAQIMAYFYTLKIRVAENAALFLWVTNPHLFTGGAVMEAWGFEYKTCFMWEKTDDCPGIGFYIRSKHEQCLLGIRGRMRPRQDLSPPIDSVWKSPRTKHSRKPIVAYEDIERMYPDATRLELFAREIRPGWDQIGNQLGQAQLDIAAAARRE